MHDQDKSSLLALGKSWSSSKGSEKSEKLAWMFKTSFLASFMAVWVVAPLAILVLPNHVPHALLMTVATTWIVTPVVSNQLITNLVQSIKEQQQLTYMAHHDGMTGLMNRTFFLDQLQDLQQNCIQSSARFGIVTVDIDHFKSINDRFGHAIGDEVIIGFAHLMRDLAPDDAIVGRTGGEEFTIAMRGTQRRVENYVSKLCVTGAKMNFAGTGATLSAGFIMGCHENHVDLCVRSDAALYEAKNAGRNCYRMAA